MIDGATISLAVKLACFTEGFCVGDCEQLYPLVLSVLAINCLVDILTSPRSLPQKGKLRLPVYEDFKKHAFLGYIAEEKKKKRKILCWKMCTGKQVYSSINGVNYAQEYQIKPEDKVSYLCLMWERKNCAVTGTCIVANR